MLKRHRRIDKLDIDLLICC